MLNSKVYDSRRLLTQNWDSFTHRLWTTGIISDYHPIKFLSLLMFIISGAQIVFLNIQTYTVGNLNSNTAFDKTLNEIASIFTISEYINLKIFSSSSWIILMSILVYTMMILGLMITLLVHLKLKKRVPQFISVNFSTISYAHLFIFFMPISTACIQVIYQSGQDHSISIGYMAVALIIEILNLLFAFIGCSIYLHVKSRDPFSRLNNFYIVNSLCQKFLISTLNVFLYGIRATSGPLMAITLIVCLTQEIITKMALMVRIPFLKFKFNQIAVGYSGITSILAILNCIHWLSKNLIEWKYNHFFGILIFSALTIKIELSFINKNRACFSFFSNVDIKNEFWSLQSFFYFRKLIYRGFAFGPEEKYFPLLSLIGRGIINTIPGTQSNDMMKISNKTDILIKCLKRIISISQLSNIPKLLLAQTLFHYQDTMNETCSISCDISLKSDVLTEKLSSLKIQSDIRRKLKNSIKMNNDQIDLQAFFRHQKAFIQMRNVIIEQIDLHNSLYGQIIQPKLNLLDFMRKSHDFFVVWPKVDKIWAKYSQEFSRICFSSILLYAFHNLLNRHNPGKCIELIAKFKQLIALKMEFIKQPQLDSTTLYDPRNIAILLSASKYNIGTIYEVTPSIKPVLGFNVEEVKHKNLNIIMPRFFQSIHNSMILKKSDDSQRLETHKVFSTFALDRTGYMLPINILTCVYPLIDDGLMIFGLLRVHQSSNVDYAIVNDDLEIENYSQNLAEQLGFEQKQKYKLMQVSRDLYASVKKIVKHIYHKEKNQKVINPEMDSKDMTCNEYLVQKFEVENKEDSTTNVDSPTNAHQKAYSIIESLLRDGMILSFSPISQSGTLIMNENSLLYKVKCTIKVYESKPLILLSFQFIRNKSTMTSKINSYVFNNMFTLTESHQTLPDNEKNLKSGKTLKLIAKKSMPNNPTLPSNHRSGSKKSSKLLFLKKDLNSDSFTTYNQVSIDIPKDESNLRDGDTNEEGIYMDPPKLETKLYRDPFKNGEKSFRDPKSYNDIENQIKEEDEVDEESIHKSVENYEVIPTMHLPTNSSDAAIDLEQDENEVKASTAITEFKKKNVSFERYQDNIRLFNFHAAPGIEFTFHMLAFYVSCFLLTILIIYLGAVLGVPKIKSTMETAYFVMEANNYIYKIIQGETIINFDLTVRNSGSYLNGTKMIIDHAEKLVSKNSEISINIENLNEDLQTMILADNIRIFYDDFDLMQSSYKNYDFSEASKILATESIRFSNLADPSNLNNPSFIFSEKFIQVNLLNDYFIKLHSFVRHFAGRIENQVKGLQDQALYALLAFASMSVFLHISASILFVMFTKNNTLFSESLFSISYDEDIQQEIKKLRIFKESILNENYEELVSGNGLKQKYQHSKKELVKHKVSKKIVVASRSMAMMAVTRYMTMSASLGASFIVIIFADVIFITSIGTISPYYNDIIKACEIQSQLQTVTIETIKMSINPSLKVKNDLVTDALTKDLNLLSTVISNDYTRFNLDFIERLNNDFCSHETFNFGCNDLFNGISKQGIISAIYYISEFVNKQMSLINTFTFGSPDYLQNVLNSNIENILNIVFEAITPALNYNIKLRSDELVNLANQEAANVVNFVFICFALAASAGVGPKLFIYPRMLEERVGLAKSVLMLPSRLVLSNRAFKEFLMRDSPEFLQIIIRNEKLYQESNVVRRLFD